MKRLHRILAAVTFVLLPALAAGQSYPDRPIRVILPVPAGGTPDVLARLVAPSMSEQLGQQFVMDNRGGAGGLIGAEMAAHAVPDGYTLFLASPGALTILPHLSKKVPYDPFRDFAPIGMVCTGPFLLLVHSSVPAKTVKDLVALAKAEPGKLDYSSAGNGTANHLAMELFKSMAGVNFNHVPYKGAPQAVTDLLAGRVSVTMNSIPPIMPHVKSGRVRALGVAGAQRSPLLPEVPTITEAGVPGYESGSWLGMLAPARTPPKILARLNAVMATAVRSPALRSKLEAQGAEAVGGTPEDFARRIRKEFDENGKIVKAAGVRID